MSASVNRIRVALVGNPNAGKSSLFNALTGLNQKTGNYAGVTVDKHVGITTSGNTEITLVDLPGIYSLNYQTIDEQVACEALMDDTESINVAVIVIDACNIKRSLLLATQVIDLKFPSVLVLNMIDEARKQNIVIDREGLSKTLGVEVVEVDSRNREGIDELKHVIANRAGSGNVFFHDVTKIENYREAVSNAIRQDAQTKAVFFKEDQLHRASMAGYIFSKYVKTPEKLLMQELSLKIDKLVTHKILGYLVLLMVLALVFQFIFYVAEFPMQWIEEGFMGLSDWIKNHMAAGSLRDLLTEGVLSGISGVIMFVPQIAFLFLFIGLLEDSGYMARASFIMDRIMRRFGLNGRSVIPLISGTACAVPSIMATRSISNLKERMITVFVLPLISCSARLPVYTLIISLLFPDDRVLGVFNLKGLALLLMYFLGFVAAIAAAYVLNKLIRKKETSLFMMELPVYRPPQIRNVLIMVTNKVKVFLWDAGKIIFAISVVLWYLSAHGPSQITSASDASKEYGNQVPLEESYVGILGKAIEPAIAPLGFDWKIGISLITSFAAREVFVGTMATIYGSDDSEEGIRQKLSNEKNAEGVPVYSAAVCWSLLMFYAFALQCISTIATVKRETAGWKWPIIQTLFMSALAYFSSFAVYQALS